MKNYTIINKIELEGNGNLLYTEVAYTTNEEVIIDINVDFDETLGKFMAENRTNLENENITIGTFFDSIPFVYSARTEVNTLEGIGLNEISNKNQL